MVGIRGNEIADRLAKRGANKVVYGPEPIVPLTWNAIKAEVRMVTEMLHRKEWLDSRTAIHTKLMWGDLNKGKTKALLGMTPANIGKMVQLITGHGQLAKHMHRMGLIDSPLCSCGEEDETPLHLIAECLAKTLARWRHFTVTFIDKNLVQNLKLTNVHDFFRDVGHG